MKPTVSDAIPAASAGSARERRVDVYIISGDDALLLELGPALGDRFRTRPIERMDELPADLQAPWIGFVDGGRADARTWIQHIEKSHPHAALIAIVDGADLAHWQGMVFRGSVCAALGTQQLATAALNDALTRAQQRLQQATTANRNEPPRQLVAPGKFNLLAFRPSWLLPAAVAGLAAVALLGWLLSRHPSAPPATVANPAGTGSTTQTPAAAPAEPVLSALELLSSARSAFRDPDRQLPRGEGRQRGDSALELYAQVLIQEPANAEARDGLRRLYTVGRSRMQSDMAAGRMEDALRMLAIFRTAGIDPAAMKAMESDVTTAQPRWLQSQVRRGIAANDIAAAEQAYAQLASLGGDRAVLQDLRRALDSRQADSQLQGLAEEVHAAVVAGALLEPAGTSARARLQAMRQVNRNHPTTVAAQRDLQEALLARAREAQAAALYDPAQRWLAAAAELGASNEVTELRRQLQADIDKATARAAPAPAAPAAAAATAAPAPAAPPSPAAPQLVAARPQRPLKVDYPSAASTAKVQGHVVVEFTLNPDGRATDVQVVESSPTKIFDRSALDAVGRGRYDPSVLGDSAQPRRARIRLTFKPG